MQLFPHDYSTDGYYLKQLKPLKYRRYQIIYIGIKLIVGLNNLYKLIQYIYGYAIINRISRL